MQLSILMVTARYVPEIGGTEIHTKELAQRLVRRGHRVTVLTTDRTGTFPKTETRNGIDVVRVPAWPREADYFFSPDIYRFIRRGKWDIVHVQGYHTFVAPMAMIAAQRSRAPYVVAFHSGGHSSRLRRMLRTPQVRLLKPLLCKADRLIASNPAEQLSFENHLNCPNKHIAMIPITFALPDKFVEKIVEPNDDGPLIVSIGRLEEFKGHHLLINAMPHVLKTHPDAHLRIVGEGPYRDTLLGLAESLRIQEHVAIKSIPIERRDAMAKLLAKASVVASMSKYESAGIAIREAIGVHRKVVISETEGFDDIRQLANVFTVERSSSAEVLAKALTQAIASSPVNPAESLFTWETCTDEFERIYFEVVAKT